MNFKPILFSTEMVKAIIEGRKSQTRRIIKEALGWDYNWSVCQIKEEHKDGLPRYEMRCGTQYSLPWFKSKYNVGDILWVRETFYAYGFWILVDGEWHFDDCTNQFQEQYLFENCKPKVIEKGRCNGSLGWYKRPSIHMPKSACRIFLKVKSLRVERLQDISEEDAIAEGIEVHPKDNRFYKNYIRIDLKWCDSSVRSFETLWQLINGMQSWESNPFVWVIEFERIELTPEQRKQFLNS